MSTLGTPQIQSSVSNARFRDITVMGNFDLSGGSQYIQFPKGHETVVTKRSSFIPFLETTDPFDPEPHLDFVLKKAETFQEFLSAIDNYRDSKDRIVEKDSTSEKFSFLLNLRLLILTAMITDGNISEITDELSNHFDTCIQAELLTKSQARTFISSLQRLLEFPKTVRETLQFAIMMNLIPTVLLNERVQNSITQEQYLELCGIFGLEPEKEIDHPDEFITNSDRKRFLRSYIIHLCTTNGIPRDDIQQLAQELKISLPTKQELKQAASLQPITLYTYSGFKSLIEATISRDLSQFNLTDTYKDFLKELFTNKNSQKIEAIGSAFETTLKRVTQLFYFGSINAEQAKEILRIAGIQTPEGIFVPPHRYYKTLTPGALRLFITQSSIDITLKSLLLAALEREKSHSYLRADY